MAKSDAINEMCDLQVPKDIVGYMYLRACDELDKLDWLQGLRVSFDLSMAQACAIAVAAKSYEEVTLR